MAFNFLRETGAEQASVESFNTTSTEAMLPLTEDERHGLEVELESLRSEVDALHAARAAVGNQACEPAMEHFLAETGLCDPYSAEHFSTESFDLLGGGNLVPAALDVKIREGEASIRELRNAIR